MCGSATKPACRLKRDNQPQQVVRIADRERSCVDWVPCLVQQQVLKGTDMMRTTIVLVATIAVLGMHVGSAYAPEHAEIDIKPGSNVNPINVAAVDGVIPVAIMGE